MISERLKQLVAEEAKSLMEYATVEERNKLNFKELKPNYITSCIYGQMTGGCRNVRAVELLNQCAKPYSRQLLRHSKPLNNKEFDVDSFYFYSPIECYINKNEAKNESLISYLRGETDNLKL